jgi:hypothetical protein
MNTRAGSQLWRRNPRQEPATAAIRITVPAFPCSMAYPRKLNEMMVTTPPASPSSPSIRLIALVTPTIQSSETKPPNRPR